MREAEAAELLARVKRLEAENNELKAENEGLKRDIQCMLEAANRSLAAYRELGEKLFSRSISASFAASLAENEKLFNAYWKEKIP